jgi:hypothetical protein
MFVVYTHFSKQARDEAPKSGTRVHQGADLENAEQQAIANTSGDFAKCYGTWYAVVSVATGKVVKANQPVS